MVSLEICKINFEWFIIVSTIGWKIPLGAVVSWPLNCLQVLNSEIKDRSQYLLNDDPSEVTKQISKTWDIFSKYHPEFKIISRVSNSNSILFYHYNEMITTVVLFFIRMSLE